MYGLLIVTFGGLYLATIFFATRWAWRRGRFGGGSWIKASGFSLIVFLAIYLPLFWNHIPMVLAHRAMCRDAGFSAMITPQAWISENRLYLSTIRRADLDKRIESPRRLATGFRSVRFFGGLLESQQREVTSEYLGVSVIKYEEYVFDAKTGARLATMIDYYVGSQDDPRIWLHRPSCGSDGGGPAIHQYINFLNRLKDGVQ